MIAMADSFQSTSYFSASPASNWGGVQPFVATPVRYKNKEFSSASSALEAYIDDFQGRSTLKDSQKYKRDVDELLVTSKSSLELSQRPHRSLDVSDRFEQEKWSRMRELVERSYDQMKLQASMESAKESLSASMMLKQKLQENSRNVGSNETWSAQDNSYLYKQPTNRHSQNSSFKHTDFRSNSDSEIRAMRLHRQSNGISSSSGMDLATSVPNMTSQHFSEGYAYSERLHDRSTHGILTTANGVDLITREQSSYPKLYRHTINGHVTFEDEEATGNMTAVEANLAARRRAVETTPRKSKPQPANLHSFSSLDRSRLYPSHLTTSQEPSPILGDTLNMTDLNSTPSAKQTRFDPRTKTEEPSYFDSSKLSRSRQHSLLDHRSNHRKTHKTDHRYIDLDKASLTTDDLLMAAPGGSNVISKGRSKSVNDVSKLTTVSEHSPKRSHKSSKDHYQKENYTAVAHNFSRSGTLGLLGSPNSSRMNSPRSKNQTNNESTNNNQNNYVDTDSTLGYHGHKTEHSERRRAFVKNLIQEVDCSASSVVTAPTLDELQYVPSKKTTVSQSKLTGTPSHLNPYQSMSSRSFSHHSPETDELLIEPALPYIDVSPTSLGTSYAQDLPQGGIQDEEDFEFSFSDRLQKLLSIPLSPPDLETSGKDVTSPDTERILNEERPWEKTKNSYKPPMYVNTESSPARGYTMVDNFMKDCLKTPEKTQKKVDSNSRLSGREQPGSMEALKNMLFTVQSMTADDMDDISRISEVTEDSFGDNGSDALGKAMLHLDRMKNLMQK